jgi:hypothetical protein
MKRLIVLALTSLSITLGLPAADANSLSSSTIFLTEPTHRELDGKFIDDGLAALISPTGSLGAPLFNLSRGQHIWVIDPLLVEEVSAMSSGYTLISGAKPLGQDLAKNWLTQLKIDTTSGSVYAMAYGNPSEYWVNRLSPHNKSYILAIAQSKLTTLLGRTVLEANEYQSNNNFYINHNDLHSLQNTSAEFEETSGYVTPSAIDTYRLGLVKALNPHLTQQNREFLINDLANAAGILNNSIHLSQGKFTVTSANQKLPVTLTNNFPTPVQVRIDIEASNARVSVPSTLHELLPANSKTQILLPIQVYSSGGSALSLRVSDLTGHSFGELVVYPLTLSVISPVATWITTGAAIMLFVAASIQSIRRIRRRRK